MLIDPPEDLGRHRRLVILGVTGSGKSTLALRLADLGGMPYVSVDDIMWLPGWVKRDEEDARRVVGEIVDRPAWVLDALWTATRDLVVGHADLVVALDYPRWVSLGRLLRRTARRLHDRQEICGGNTESWRSAVSRESILAWHFRSFTRRQREIAAWAGAADGPPMVRFTEPRATDAWVRRLAAVTRS